jgi:hypothetical protein
VSSGFQELVNQHGESGRRYIRKSLHPGKFIQSLGSPFDDLIKIVRQTGKPGKIQHFHLTAEVADVEEPVVVEFDPVKVPAKMVSMVKVFFLGYHPLMLFLRILNIFNRRKQKS